MKLYIKSIFFLLLLIGNDVFGYERDTISVVNINDLAIKAVRIKRNDTSFLVVNILYGGEEKLSYEDYSRDFYDQKLDNGCYNHQYSNFVYDEHLLCHATILNGEYIDTIEVSDTICSIEYRCILYNAIPFYEYCKKNNLVVKSYENYSSFSFSIGRGFMSKFTDKLRIDLTIADFKTKPRISNMKISNSLATNGSR